MKCKNCQTENEPDAKYCRHCGSPLYNPATPGKKPPFNKDDPSKNKKPGLKKQSTALIAGVLILVGAAGAGWYFLSSKNPEQNNATMYTEKELIEKANALYSMGDIEGAANICQQMLAQDPGNERVQGLLTNLQAVQDSVDKGETTVDAQDPFISYSPTEDTRKYAIGHYELPADQPVLDSYSPQEYYQQDSGSQDGPGEQRMFVLQEDPSVAVNSSVSDQPESNNSQQQNSGESSQAAAEQKEQTQDSEKKEVQTAESEEKDSSKLEVELPVEKEKQSSSSGKITLKSDMNTKETGQKEESSLKTEESESEEEKSVEEEDKEDSKAQTSTKTKRTNSKKETEKEKTEEESSSDKEEQEKADEDKKQEEESKEEKTAKPVPNVLERSVLVLGPGESYTFENPDLSVLELASPAKQTLTKSASPKTLLSVEEGTITNIAKDKEDGVVVAAKKEGNNDECLILVTNEKKAKQANDSKFVVICNENILAGIKNTPAQEISIKVKSQPVLFRADDLASDEEDQDFTWKITKEGNKNQSKIVPDKNYCMFYPGANPAKTTLTATNAEGEKVQVIINIVA